MGGTRIFVFQLKQIIKTGIFVLIGLILVITLVWFLVPKGENAGSASLYMPGTYSAQIILHNKPVNIEVTVTENEITNVALTNMLKSQEMFYPLFKPTIEVLAKEIIQKQSTDVAISGENVVTGMILINAVNAALGQAVDAQTVAK